MNDYITKSKFAVKPGVIYITATPIGNLGDITIRALETLQGVDFIICEDSRKTSILLQHYGIKSKLFVYNDHSDEKQRSKFLNFIGLGKSAALVSDAGMPLIADPGYKLVLDAIAAGIEVSVIPGASATLSALALSGLPSEKFVFYGFMPEKQVARAKAIDEIAQLTYSTIFFESAKRLETCLQALSAIMPQRHISIARELTKLHEEVYRGDVQSALIWCSQHENMRGELVVILAGNTEPKYDLEQIKQLVAQMLSSHSVKDTVQQIAQNTGISKKQLYDLCLSMQKES